MNTVILSSCLVMIAGLWSVMVTAYSFRNQPLQLPGLARKTQWLSMGILLLQFQGLLHYFSDLPFTHLYAGMAWVCVWLVLQISCQLIQPGWQSSGHWIWFLG
jgi:hypothetical protein